MDLVPAVWNGPYPGETLDGKTLQPGDEHQVTEAELESGHWRAKGGKRKSSGSSGNKKAARKPKPASTSPTSGGHESASQSTSGSDS